MAGQAHDRVNATSPDGGTSASTLAQAPAGKPKPITTAEAKARLLVAADACDPSRFVQKHPFGSVVGAAALGMLSAQSPGVQKMLSNVIEMILKYSARESAQPPSPPAPPNTPS